ncbi:MAG: DEAD/DEAH box helicase, partial [Phaeodactylibacter sp.]|nr:DEAD/DEAH box helicase [Phaeodactylibacter sp.]
IPIIMNGQDVLACAQTGTGKTAAFLLPVLHDLCERPTDAIATLILVPTRELAIQIDQQLEGLAYFTGISSLAIYGGRDGGAFNQEKKALTQGADIIVATPGRLIAHLNMGYVKFGKLRHLILDEADRMLDMGFAPDIQKITSYIPQKRQNLMFSATMPPKIKSFANKILNNPAFIQLAISKPADGIMQWAYRVNSAQKVPLLNHILTRKQDERRRTLIFASTKSSVKDIAADLKKSGLDVGEIHSDLEQDDRKEALRQFKNGNLPILVATDILSRGIDVKNIHLVINFDVPSDGEDYIHRIGRTARADTEGTALTFVTRKDARKFKDIEELMGKEVRLFPVPDFLQDIKETAASAKKGGRYGSSKSKPKGRGGNKRPRRSAKN